MCLSPQPARYTRAATHRLVTGARRRVRGARRDLKAPNSSIYMVHIRAGVRVGWVFPSVPLGVDFVLALVGLYTSDAFGG